MRTGRLLLPLLALVVPSPGSAQIRSASPRPAQSTQQGTTLTVVASPSTVAAAAKQAGKNAITAATEVKAQFPTVKPEDIGLSLLAAGYTPLETLIALKSVMSATLDQQLLALASGKLTLVDIVRAMHDANKDLTAQAMTNLLVVTHRVDAEIITSIAQSYGLSPIAVGALLRLAGRNHFDVAEALRIALKIANVDALADALRASGFQEDGIALGLVSSLNATPNQIAAAFHRWNVAPERAAQVLNTTLKQSAQDALKAMAQADYKAAQLARAARDAFRATSGQAFSFLIGVQLSPVAAIKALMEGLGLDDQGAFDAALAANVPAPQAMSAVIDAATIAGARAATLLKLKGIDPVTAGSVLKTKYAATSNQVADFMKQGTYTAKDVATMCKSVFQQSAHDAAATLVATKFEPQSIIEALTQIFQIGIDAATQILVSLGIKV